MEAAPQAPFFDARETWPEERLGQWQLRQLQGLCQYAYRNLPFYRERFDRAGVHPQALRNLEDLQRFPVLTKKEIFQARASRGSFAIGMEAIRAEPAVLSMSSGTMGTTFFYCGQRWRRFQGERLLRAYRWAGLRPGMKLMMTVPAWHRWAAEESYVAQRLGAVCLIPWGTFLPRFSQNFLNLLVELKPDFVSLFLPMLYNLLAECRRQGLDPRLAFSGVHDIIIVGAPVTPRSRERLQEQLGVADVFLGAGSSEGLLAMECAAHDGYHLFPDTCYIEVVHPTTGKLLPAGQRGRVLLTSLNPHGSVYLRYDSEDLGAVLPQRCSCGRTWPLIVVYDRLANAFVVAGKELVPYDVRLCLDEVPQLTGAPCSIIRSQGSMSHLRLVIQEPVGASPEALGEQVRAVIAQKLQMSATVEWVEELPARWKSTPVIEERDWRATHG